MENIIIIDEKKFEQFPAVKFHTVDFWGRVVMLWEEKNLFFKTIVLESDVLKNLEHKEEHSLYSIASWDEDWVEGEPDTQLIFSVFPIKHDNGKIEIACYKKIKEKI